MRGIEFSWDKVVNDCIEKFRVDKHICETLMGADLDSIEIPIQGRTLIENSTITQEFIDSLCPPDEKNPHMPFIRRLLVNDIVDSYIMAANALKRLAQLEIDESIESAIERYLNVQPNKSDTHIRNLARKIIQYMKNET